jgi:hypothetical protein
LRILLCIATKAASCSVVLVAESMRMGVFVGCSSRMLVVQTTYALGKTSRSTIKCLMLSLCYFQVLGDNTDQLVELLINFFRNGINDATAGLSDSATKKIMEQVRHTHTSCNPSYPSLT